MNSKPTISKPWALWMLSASVLFFHPSIQAQTVQNQNTQDDPYFQIGEVTTTVEEISDSPITPALLQRAHQDFLQQRLSFHPERLSHSSTPSLSESASVAAVDPMAIADILLKLWDIVVDNKPVVNVAVKSANALPNLAQNNWEKLTGWQDERSVIYSMTTKNLYGMKVIQLEYRLSLIYGGGVDGQGRYIASARVVPTKVDVLWGYNLDVNVSIPSIVNMGSKDDPLAGIYVDVNYKVHNILRSDSEGQTYYLQGDGLMKDTKSGQTFFASAPR